MQAQTCHRRRCCCCRQLLRVPHPPCGPSGPLHLLLALAALLLAPAARCASLLRELLLLLLAHRRLLLLPPPPSSCEAQEERSGCRRCCRQLLLLQVLQGLRGQPARPPSLRAACAQSLLHVRAALLLPPLPCGAAPRAPPSCAPPPQRGAAPQSPRSARIGRNDRQNIVVKPSEGVREHKKQGDGALHLNSPQQRGDAPQSL
jgi:hypothetical protein